jgi:hypothetical protein
LAIKCLSGGCPKRYREVEIKAFVDPNIYYKYKKFYNKQIKLQNPNNSYVQCPAFNCEELVDITYQEKHFNMVECNNNHRFCFICKSTEEHKKDECHEVKNIIIKA